MQSWILVSSLLASRPSLESHEVVAVSRDSWFPPSPQDEVAVGGRGSAFPCSGDDQKEGNINKRNFNYHLDFAIFCCFYMTGIGVPQMAARNQDSLESFLKWV